MRTVGGSRPIRRSSAGLRDALMENEKLSAHPEICAKLAELHPMVVADVRVVVASKRIAMDTPEIEEIITIIRRHVL